jgi:trk/ktr system potassium uptake protein
VRHGDVTQVHSLRRGAAEAIEAVMHGDLHSGGLAGRRIEQIDLPRGSAIGAVVRGEQVLMAHHDTEVRDGDRVIVFVTDKKVLPKVEKLFQVGVSFV